MQKITNNCRVVATMDLKGHSIITRTKFYPILTPFSHLVDNWGHFTNYLPFVYVTKRWLSTDHLPTSSCSRSYWMPPYLFTMQLEKSLSKFEFKFLFKQVFQNKILNFQSFQQSFTDWILQNCLVKLQIRRLFNYKVFDPIVQCKQPQNLHEVSNYSLRK